MKQTYEAPALEVIAFEAEDVITTSGGSSKNPGGNEGEGIVL